MRGENVQMKKTIFSFIVITLTVFLGACNQNDDADTEQEIEEQIIAVETTHITEGDLSIDKTLYGRTAPSSITPVMLQMPGEIDVLEVENGDRVEEDDLIAKIKTPAGIQEIKAPATGEIANLDFKEGDIATESEPFAIVVDMDELLINFGVTSNVRALLEKEKNYQSKINDETYEAKITSISSMPDDTGLYPVEAVVENKDDKLLPGMVAMLTIPEKKVKASLILPTEAIIEDSEGTYIYVVEDDLAVKTEVNILETQSDQSAFEGEVNEGDEVIINGQLTISDGSKVNVVEEENQS